jgi:ABC-2 type transport system ATP-binding protein
MLPEGAVEVNRLWKRFRQDENRWALTQQTKHKIAKMRHRDDHFWRYALRDIDFKIEPGESVGLVGPNGSGKSTLLKILTGVTYPYAGSIMVQGRVGALIEVRAGIQNDLSGRDNVYLYGSLLGLKRQDVKKRFDRIVEFAELEDAIDRQVKFYSSGMQMRLGFSVVAHLDPAIMLVDEVLAVGDATFQQKCHNRMRETLEGGTTLILVSHDLAAVEGIASRCLLMTDGVLRADGAIRDVLSIYRQWIEETAAQPEGVQGDIQVLKASATHDDGGSPRSDDAANIRLVVHTDEPRAASIFLGVSEGPATPIFVLRYNGRLQEGETELSCRLRHLPLPGGRFFVWMYVMETASRRELLPWHPVCFFDVIGGKLQKAPRGIVRLSAVQVAGDWTVD